MRVSGLVIWDARQAGHMTLLVSGDNRETESVGAGCEVYSRLSRETISESVRVRRMRPVAMRVPVLIKRQSP